MTHTKKMPFGKHKGENIVSGSGASVMADDNKTHDALVADWQENAKKHDDNYSFLRSLKQKSFKKVDRIALELHQEAFSILDCTKCAIFYVLVSPHSQVHVFHTADVEAIKMLTFPAHRYLDECMKFFQGAVLRLNPPPNGRVDASQGHLDLKHGVGLFRKPSLGHLVRVDGAAEQVRHLRNDTQNFLLFIPLRTIHRLFNKIEEFIQFIERKLRAICDSAL